MSNNSDLAQVLKEAAVRCDDYLPRYGLEVTWSLSPIGLKLTARFGADCFERYVDWFALGHSVNPQIELASAEQAALAGLSS